MLGFCHPSVGMARSEQTPDEKWFKELSMFRWRRRRLMGNMTAVF